jgi:hypothetical protein
VCTWIEKIVCTIYRAIVDVICVVIDLATAILGTLITILEAVLNWAWSIVGFIWGILTSIPGLGRLLAWVHGLATLIFNAIISIPDVILGFIGILPEKKLRLGIIVLKSAERAPIAEDELLLRAVQCTINVFKAELNVRVIPIRYAQYQNAWSDDQVASSDYLFHDDAPSSNRLLDVCCDGCAFGEGIGTVGADFNLKMVRHTFWGNGRRLLGYGAPVVAFTVRSVEGARGCSLGPLHDWVTVHFADSNNTGPNALTNAQLTPDALLGDPDGPGSISTLCHEVAHACSVFPDHQGDNSNIMHTPPPRRSHFYAWQVALARSSRHITYF